MARQKKGATFAVLLLLGTLGALPVCAYNGQTPKSDNTKMNKQDRMAGSTTADQQKMNAADRALTRKIRRALTSDKSLSTYAHNVKIVSRDGMVTLKGPVRSEAEKASVESKAVEAAGGNDKVTNELTVAPAHESR